MIEHSLDLRSVSNEFETARSLIEDRFIKGGDALMTAHDIVSALLGALDGVTGALSDDATDAAIGRLAATMEALARLVEIDTASRAKLAAIVADGGAIAPRIADMQGALRYLATCAIETKIAGAGVPEFVSFADDVTAYVTNAGTQVAQFADKVASLNRQLAGAADHGAGSDFADKVPRVTRTLHDAAEAVRIARASLGKLAGGAETIANSVQAKVAKVLSALQIGDVTRQRIEHVQAGIALLTEALASKLSPEADAALEAAGISVLRAQTTALIKDFHLGSSVIVSTIDGLAFEAERILTLTRTAAERDADPITAIKEGVALAHTIVSHIEDASIRAAAAHAAACDVATELLGNMGSIGNLRNVRDDIRCLAINAYLRSNRIGEKGRAVGVVAAEMNNYASRLGVAAESILSRLGAMRQAAAELGATGAPQGLAGDLDTAEATLRQAALSIRNHIETVKENGHAVAERIGRIAGELDFRSELGERLEKCRQTLSTLPAEACPDDSRLAEFSSRLYAVYTMASERDIHLANLSVPGADLVVPGTTKVETGTDEGLFDDVLF
jgi:hypothetical protein